MTFDYARAWREVAAPAYKALPHEIYALISRVRHEAADLHQLPDCSMPWPGHRVISDEDAALARPGANMGLRQALIEVDPAILAYAARVVYYAGHWCPSLPDAGDYQGLSCDMRISGGAYWKFSHYADQVLRELLPSMGHKRIKVVSGWTREIHEGVVRICYSSRNLWTWIELCPAYRDAVSAAREEAARLQASTLGIFRSPRDRDMAVCRAIESARGVWPTPEWAAIMDTKRFMVEEVRR